MHTTPQQFDTELKLLALTSLLEKGVLSRLEYESDRLELVTSLALDNLLSPPVGGE